LGTIKPFGGSKKPLDGSMRLVPLDYQKEQGQSP